MERTLKVIAKGVKRVSADTVEIEFTVKAQDLSYDNMLKISEEQLITMQNLVKKAGFEKKQLRTQNYKIRTIYDNVKKKNGDYETVFQDMNASRSFC